MTALETLLELLERVGASRHAAALVSEEELCRWPADVVRELKAQKLVVKASPAATVVCPGCPQECTMPIHSLPAGAGPSVAFVVCDKRDDINRVPVATERLRLWRCSVETVGTFVARNLGLRAESQRKTDVGLWELGLVKGKKRNQMVCLRANEALELVAGNNAVPLAELVRFVASGYSVDREAVRELVDSATTGDSRYTPSNARREVRRLETQERYESWRKERRSLKARHPEMSDSRCAVRISKMGIAHGCDSETIRKHFKK